MKKQNIFLYISILTTILYIFISIFDLFGGHSGNTSNIIYLFFPFLTTIAIVFTIDTYGWKSYHGRAFSFIALGYLFWLEGELLWIILDSYNISPFPSFADIFYLAAYPLVFIGFWEEASIRKLSTIHKRKPLENIIVIIFTLILLGLVGYYGIYKAYDPNSTITSNVIAILYGIADIPIIIISIFIYLLTLDYKGGRIAKAWMLIVVGLIVMLGGDLLFSLFRNQFNNELKPYVYIDILYVFSYLFVALGMFYIRDILEDINRKIKNLTERN